MTSFSGFPPGKVRFTSIPGQFFTELLPKIDHLGELKVTLYAFWQFDRMEGDFRYLEEDVFSRDPEFMAGLEDDSQTLRDSLKRCVTRGILLEVEVELKEGRRNLYFLNTQRGQSAVSTIEAGGWEPTGDRQYPIALTSERPNIFRLYEENFGGLTPLLADTLKEAEELYPVLWIDEAINIAVENNVRKWRYVEAILNSWKKEGKDERTDKRGSEKDRQKYVEGEFSQFIEH